MTKPRDPVAYREYMRDYMRKRYARVRVEAIARLGGQCVRCGAVELLEFDHVDPKFKIKEITALFYKAADRFEAEILKCQLLCEACHKAKTLVDLGKKPAAGTHGTLSAYRYCKCDLCRAAKSAHNQAAYVARGIAPRLPPEHGSAVMYTYHKCRCSLCRVGNTERHKARRIKKAQAAFAGTLPHSSTG